MKQNVFLCIGLCAVAMACGPETQSDSKLVVSGLTDASSFAAPVTTVEARRGAAVVAQAPVGADGSFSITVPSGVGYQLRFVGAGGASTLVFPRSAGSIEARFDVLGGGVFDLGRVRHVMDPMSQRYQFSTSAQALSGEQEVECEDSVDAATGAFCVDDDEEGSSASCGDGDGEENDDEGVDCVDGIDAATGLECDGGPGADDDVEEDDGPEVPADAAIADHNLPGSFGCAEEADGEEEDD
jgi:hypothetical protein